MPAVDNKKGISRHKQDLKDTQEMQKRWLERRMVSLTFSVMFAVTVPRGQSLIGQWQSLIW